MKKYLIAVAMIAALAVPASAQLTSQQQRMKDCNTQASGMTGDTRKQFMSSCLRTCPEITESAFERVKYGFTTF